MTWRVSVTAGRRAYYLAELHQRTRSVDDSSPSSFVPNVSPPDIAWIADESSRDFLGNEFLLWLWFHTEVESDAVKLADDSEAVVMLARSLTLVATVAFALYYVNYVNGWIGVEALDMLGRKPDPAG